jgi:hypothetical protein
VLSVALNGRGLGATAPAPYKCNSTICYGSDGGATHALFKETQYQINRAGQAIFGTNWTKIGLDGFIGEKTRLAYVRLAPKIPTLVNANYAKPAHFTELSKWISGVEFLYGSRTFITDAIRRAADSATGRAEAPATISTRTGSYAQEGPAKTSASNIPNITSPTGAGAMATLPPSTQVPASSTAPAAPPGEAPKSRTGAKVFIGVVAAAAVIGLVATAAYSAKRRRRQG